MRVDRSNWRYPVTVTTCEVTYGGTQIGIFSILHGKGHYVWRWKWRVCNVCINYTSGQ